MAKLLYQGHASIRIETNSNVIVYVDPYVGEGYDLPADLILVTHQHGDHNQVDLVSKKPDCVTITNNEAVKPGTDGREYGRFSIKDVEIEAVEASNSNHNPDSCVGYIITVDGIKIYAAGDTSKTEQMESFKELCIDYALLPCDGVYNMGIAEASECAGLICAKHNIPIHMKPGALFDKAAAESFTGPGRLILEPGEMLEL